MPRPSSNRPPLQGQRVQFVTPATPAFTGNGLAMRAASLLAAMCREGASISLVIIPIYKSGCHELEPDVIALCREWRRIPATKSTWRNRAEARWQWLWARTNSCWPLAATGSWRRQVERALSESEEDLLVVYRLSAFAFLSRRRMGRRPCWLDLDELDSTGLKRQAALAEAIGDHEGSETLEREAAKIEEAEHSLLDIPQWLSVSSKVERQCLSVGLRSKTLVVPNAISPRTFLPPNEHQDSPFRCLFVGSFGHPPNADAVFYFCREILPSLQKLCVRPVEFVVAGPDLGHRLASLGATPNVRLLGRVEDLELVYRDANIVVVPLRAGAGTRIKILEAFSFGRAVVSTAVGAEGLSVESGRELILAEGEEFAPACASLLSDPARQRRLIANARAYVERMHHPEAVRRSLRESPAED